MFKKEKRIKDNLGNKDVAESVELLNLYKRLVEFTGEGVYRYTFDEGRIIFANQSLVKILDLDCRADALVGKLLRDVLIYTQKPGTIRKIANDKGEVHNLEYHFKTLKGEDRWVIHDSFVTVDKKTGKKVVEAIVKDITERKKIEQALEASESKYRLVADNTYDWVFWLSPKGNFVYSSPSCKLVTGFEAEKFMAELDLLSRIIHPDDQVHFDRHRLRAMQRKVHSELEFRIITKDGSLKWLHHVCQPVFDSGGKFLGMRSSNHDITERKETDNKLKKLNRNLLMISQCNQMMVRVADESELLRQICRVIADFGGYRFVWVGFAEADETKTVRSAEYAGHEQGYLKKIKISWADDKFGRGPTGTAIRTAKPVICKDILKDQKYSLWRAEALKRGYASSIAIPLIIDNKAIGALNIYARERNAFDTEEVNLLMELASDLSYGIMSIRVRSERKKIEESLRESEERFRSAFETAGIGMAIVAPDGRWLKVNRSLCEILGYSEDELLAMGFQDITHPDDIGADVSYVNKMLRREIPYYYIEKRYIHKKGHILWVILSASLVCDAKNEPLYFVFQIQDITERKRIEESQARLVAILEATSDFVAIADAKGNILYMNKAGRKMLGIKEGDSVLGKKISDTLHQQAKPFIINEAIPSTIRNGIWKGETVLAGENGQEIPVLLIGLAHKARDGSVMFLSAVAHDITERKLSEKKLQETERFLSGIFSSIQDGISILDNEMRIVRVNPAIERWYSHAAPLIGKKCHEAYHFRREPCKICPAQRTLKTGKADYDVVPKVGPEGKVLGWLDLYSFPLINASTGTMDGVIEYVRDITERKKAEEALKESEKRFREVAESAREWIWEVNQEGLYTYSNHIVEEVLGYKPEEIVGKKHFYDFFTPNTKEELKKAAFEVFAKKKMFRNFVNQNVHKNGIVVVLSTSGRPILNAQGDCIGYRGVDSDITEHKRLEELKDEFVSIVSHELRTPLVIIQQGISLILEEVSGKINEEQKKVLQASMNNIERLIRIVNELLDVSKIEVGRIHLKRVLVDFVNLVKDICLHWKLETEKKHQDLRLSLPKSPMYVYIDPDRLNQVLMNLISNATKYTPEKGIISVTLREDKDKVELSVSDTGSGIAEKDIPKVFSKFPRFAKEIIDDKGYRGTGLGLAIVKELIEMHGGSIKVESKLNKGSTFSISFPKVDAEYVFKEYINHGISVAVENQFPLSVLVIRIDSFDQLRKKFGEAGARNLLGGIERVIQGCLRRKADTVVTDSGELLVLLFDTKREEIASVRGRIERAMSLYIASKEGRPLHGIGISLGNATYPEDASSDNILLYKARMINEENDIDKQKNSQ